MLSKWFPDDFSQKLIEILFEKGLLAIVLVIFTYQVGKLLEKYKAKLTYGQVIAQIKIKVYTDIRTAILQYLDLKTDYRNLLIEIKHGVSLAPQEIENRKAKYFTARDKITLITNENMPYISKDLKDKIQDYFLNPVMTLDDIELKIDLVSLDKLLYDELAIMKNEIIDGGII
ncbi:hypothetical protein [Mucilaginibacter flavidus]|uniref:hypothetical protein n=1 Tax=Mucilaginibacter flavidus TaxID=2949309 RepID=UPI002093B9D9|nr:hypothetical protein [Mucilaginibacter flavidus]MCO5949890.1 hypothetical protein [Mucilaginibacter flavidus]